MTEMRPQWDTDINGEKTNTSPRGDLDETQMRPRQDQDENKTRPRRDQVETKISHSESIGHDFDKYGQSKQPCLQIHKLLLLLPFNSQTKLKQRVCCCCSCYYFCSITNMITLCVYFFLIVLTIERCLKVNECILKTLLLLCCHPSFFKLKWLHKNWQLMQLE
jgi:hypothetical protein